MLNEMINKVICGDCLPILKSLPDKCIDLVLTDPPYGVTALEWDNDDTDWIKDILRVIKDKGAIVIFATQPFTSKVIQNYKTYYKHSWVWNKKQSGSFLLAQYQPLKITEDVIVLSWGTPNFYPIMRKGQLRTKGGTSKKSELYEALGSEQTINDDYFPTNIIEISNANKLNRVHPTQKPVALMEYLIQTYSKPDDLILDPFLGSGTTAVACKKLNRRFIGIEISPEYCKIAEQRLKQGVLIF